MNTVTEITRIVCMTIVTIVILFLLYGCGTVEDQNKTYLPAVQGAITWVK